MNSQHELKQYFEISAMNFAFSAIIKHQHFKGNISKI